MEQFRILLFAVILIFGLIAYGFSMLWFVRRYYIPRYRPIVSGADNKRTTYRLANTVRRILDFFHDIYLMWIIILIPLFFATTMAHLLDPSFFGLDIFFDSRFKLDLSALPSMDISGLKEQMINGAAAINIIPQNLFTWQLWLLALLGNSIIWCYVLLQLRNIFVFISNGDAFNSLNVKGFKKIAIAVITWNVVYPPLKYFGLDIVLKSVSINSSPAIKFTPPINFDLVAIFIGIALLVLAGVINEAVKIHEEQRLTI
ncbi:MAG: DUF2975 domain-containing protein [Desulfatiglans sp.]|jgi:flagellar biosynthesis protein FlhB|nr:DUF2975 domain-containing protein [Desulfatiglans sp.]